MDGRVVFTFSASGELATRLTRYKGANPGGFSAFVSACVETRLGRLDQDLLNSQLASIDSEIIGMERSLTDKREQKTRLEGHLRKLQADRDRVSDQRLQLLERAQSHGWLRNTDNFVGYATGPAGIEFLATCGFSDPAEALEWLKDNAQLVIR